MALNLTYNEKKLHEILGYRSRDTLNFDILGKGMGIVLSFHVIHENTVTMFSSK